MFTILCLWHMVWP